MASQKPAEPPPPVGHGPQPEALLLDLVKDYLRVTDDVEDAKIQAMIPRARLWVEEHTGLAIIQREFVELHTPRAGAIRLYRGPLVAVGSVAYVDGEATDQTFDPVAYPPSTKLTGEWPATQNGDPFTVTYTAGIWVPPETVGSPPELDISAIDPRLVGAMLALIEGEYTAGFAYPPDTITAATNCLFYLKFVAP